MNLECKKNVIVAAQAIEIAFASSIENEKAVSAVNPDKSVASPARPTTKYFLLVGQRNRIDKILVPASRSAAASRLNCVSFPLGFSKAC